MPLNSAQCLRQFIRELEDEGDLLRITEEVDPHLEIGAITRRVYELEEKAPLFENIKGRKGDGLFRVFGAPVGASRLPGKRFIRLAKSMGLSATATGPDIVEQVCRVKQRAPMPPREVPTGPVKEFKLFGDDIDLTSLPVPFLRQNDGGKFIQTYGMYVVKTPDGSWVNWSITRSMIHDKRSLVGPVIPRQDIGVIRQMWTDLGQDMPFALCFGVPPAAIAVSGMPLPKWTNETGFIGAMLGEPLDVTKCETNDLLVPFNAEFVLEGVVSRTETAPEGPMAEYPGLVFPEQKRQCPIFKVNAITYRHDPILPVCVTGRAVEESETIWAVTQAVEVLDICRAAKLPVKMVWSPFESHCLWFVVQVDRRELVALKTNIKEFTERVGRVIFSSKPGFYIPKLFIVGDDIDPTNLNDVIWAEATRCQPFANEVFFDEYPNIPLIPYISHGIRASENHYKVVKCCMLTSEFTDEVLPWKVGSFRGSYPEDLQQKVEKNWTKYGFGEVTE
ncbi:3-polyprenyl-4-hydroxybenzoate decarboxylase [Aaosphaeria arxii CBS 175.79]|uniref:Ferulic acid decarboxylase 1 n=1 Tax=Aaosphaeria arxii CBS 175.79 TaxID=1450172 RepID=A0A6A5XQQ4_9PLEO|nr:3-polyprenyl-4-hydroxybenzoate decarboxylase [Aaosphaeria arxii CBS 175.79]KAF2015226.1 3-polyprenyl-4-hydroxybenzoate decarboxylase [Aaosphaeria arxii CBS 175.79]